MLIAEFLVSLATGYAAVGLVVAVAFLVVGIDRIDPNARGVYVFRPLLVPGIVVLWPLVISRWAALERETQPDNSKFDGGRRLVKTPHRRVHRQIWFLLAFVLPVILAAAFVLRPLGAAPNAPVEIERAKDDVQ